MPITTGPARRRGTKRIIAGSVLMALSVLGALLLVWKMVAVQQDLMQGAQKVESGQSVHLEGGQKISVWVPGTDEEPAAGRCALEGPGTVDLSRSATSYTLSWGGSSWHRVLEGTPPETGDYTVSCEGPDRVRITDAGDTSTALGWMVGGLLGALLGGGLVFALGLVLLVVGLVARSRHSPSAVPGTVQYR